MTKPNARAVGKWLGLIAVVVLVMAGLAALLILVPKREVSDLRRQLQRQTTGPSVSKPSLTTPTPVSPLDVFNAEDRARQTLATMIGGLLVLVGAYFTWRNVRIAEDKQLTDRFTSAVTNLSADGEEKMALRLGGIYALERIARDSPEDHWTVMEVLTAYLRNSCPVLADTEQPPGNAIPEATQVPPKSMPADIQAILTVIGRRRANQDKGQQLDFYKTDLSKTNLRGANLRGANLFLVRLVGTYLQSSNLEGADLRKANLVKAVLVESNLARANLTDAKLGEADLKRANLREANLRGSDLRKAILGGAMLKGANLKGAMLGGAKLGEANELTQKQLDSASQEERPATLPPELYFPARPAPEPPA